MSAKLTGMVWELDLPHKHAWILMSLCDHAEHDGTKVYPGNGLTAWKTGYSVSTVKRVVRELRDDFDLLEEVEEGGATKATEWRIKTENFDRLKKPQFAKRGAKPGNQNARKTTPVQKTNRGQDEPGLKNEPGSQKNEPGSHSRTHDDRNRHIEPSSPTGGEQSSAAGDRTPQQQLTDDLYRRVLEKHKVRLSKKQYSFHLGGFSQMLKHDDPSERELERIVVHMTDTLPRYPKLSPAEALQDVRFGRDGAGRDRKEVSNGANKRSAAGYTEDFEFLFADD